MENLLISCWPVYSCCHNPVSIISSEECGRKKTTELGAPTGHLPTLLKTCSVHYKKVT